MRHCDLRVPLGLRHRSQVQMGAANLKTCLQGGKGLERLGEMSDGCDQRPSGVGDAAQGALGAANGEEAAGSAGAGQPLAGQVLSCHQTSRDAIGFRQIG
jgi:hypothetical protein